LAVGDVVAPLCRRGQLRAIAMLMERDGETFLRGKDSASRSMQAAAARDRDSE
jgi:hypothetical protein